MLGMVKNFVKQYDGKIIIGLVGEIGCGKGTASRYLEENYGALTIRFSDVLRDILKKIYLQDSRENLQLLSKSLRESFGQDILSVAVCRKISDFKSGILVLDGIRREEDIACIKQMPSFYLVAIDAGLRVRFERIRARQENSGDNTKTWREFKKESLAESEVFIREMMQDADFRIDNNGTLDQMYNQIDGMLEGLIANSKFIS
jgi:dephospho-CoA kinase